MWNWKLILGLVFGVGVSINSLQEVERLQKVRSNKLDEWVRAQIEMLDLDAPMPSSGLPSINREVRDGLRRLPNVVAVFPHLYKSDYEVKFEAGTSTVSRLLVTEKGFLLKSGYRSQNGGIPSLGPGHLLATTQWLDDNSLSSSDLPISIQIGFGDNRKDAVIVNAVELPSIGIRSFDSVLIADFHTTDLVEPELLRNAGVSVWSSSPDTEQSVKDATEAYLSDRLSLHGTPFKVYMQSGKSMVAPKKAREELANRILVAKFLSISILVSLLTLIGAINREELLRRMSLLHDLGFTKGEMLTHSIARPTLNTALNVATGCFIGALAVAVMMGTIQTGVSAYLLFDISHSLLASFGATFVTAGSVGLFLVALFKRSGALNG